MSETRPSSSFDLLAEPIQRWIWQQGWRQLHDIQERSIRSILGGQGDVILAAATAGGKTEAAFLPLLSGLLTRESELSGFRILYVSPLKALINDQFRRLDELCGALRIPVHRWHGDVSASAKAKARRNPDGILLITPESLEATFVLRGLEIPGLFQGLECVVIDELHALLDSERGVHLRSLLHRLEVTLDRRIRRLGLSATLGDMALAATYLRPDDPTSVEIIESKSTVQELRVQVRGYVVSKEPEERTDQDETERSMAAERAIATHLFKTLRGTRNLAFAGSRQCVELFADLLREISEKERVPLEFHAHHANLSKEHRAFVEERLKSGEAPATAVCTSTLELGIDIGEIESVAQIGPPFSVAALRQRLGRSGRRPGKPAILRVYIEEKELDADIHPADALRLNLVQAVAMINLLIKGWCEPPPPDAPHLSTLTHQILSVIAQHNGAGAATLYKTLCSSASFAAVDRDLFLQLLREIGNRDVGLIEQAPDGTLLLGPKGERIVAHYGFYAVFKTPEEYRVVTDGRTLGTLPISFVLTEGMTIVFSGRRWRIEAVRDEEKVIEVAPDPTGKPPQFGGDACDLHDAVVAEMRRVLAGSDMPPFVDAQARAFLAEGRAAFRRFGLAERSLVSLGEKSTLVFPWKGTIATDTLALALRACRLEATPHYAIIEIENSIDEVRGALRALATDNPPSAIRLASFIKTLQREKFHPYLSEGLLIAEAAASRIKADEVPFIAREILGQSSANLP
ncbi:MAG: DEAD/DEAH box helicase [Rhodothalassiaceae bacterium]